MGNFINNPKQEIKGGVVLPLMPNVSMIPLKGEHVVVVEYNGQHYYTGIINRTNSVNENALPGTSDTYKQNTKYGNTFERKDIRRVHVSEGEIVYEGRFGNSIKLGCNHKNNTPNIRIRAGQQPTSGSIGNVIKENINEDKSSIYLSTNETIELDGLSTSGGRSFGEESIKGNSIVMNSDKLFFNAKNGNVNVRASKDLILQGDEVFIHANKGRTIKLGPPGAIFIPTLNSEVIGELFFLLIDVITDIQVFSPKLSTPATAVSAAADLVKLGTVKLPKILNIVKNELYLNKDILVPDPRILFSRKKKKKRKKKELVTSVENPATRDDGTFDSENFERPAKRDADGNRSVGPRKY